MLFLHYFFSPWLQKNLLTHPEVTHITSVLFCCPSLSHVTILDVKRAGNCRLCFEHTCPIPHILLLRKRDTGGTTSGLWYTILAVFSLSFFSLMCSSFLFSLRHNFNVFMRIHYTNQEIHIPPSCVLLAKPPFSSRG